MRLTQKQGGIPKESDASGGWFTTTSKYIWYMGVSHSKDKRYKERKNATSS